MRPPVDGLLIGWKVGVGRHASRRIEADALSRHARHNERDSPPVCLRPPRVSCSVGQDHVTLALASLAVRLAAMVADQGLGIGMRQPFGLSAASDPSSISNPFHVQGRMLHSPATCATSTA